MSKYNKFFGPHNDLGGTKMVAKHLDLIVPYVKRNFGDDFCRSLLLTFYHETDKFNSLVEYDETLGNYRGAGVIMFSTQRNYNAFSKYVGANITYKDLLDPVIDFIAVIWYINHNKLFKCRSFKELTRKVTGARGKRLEAEYSARLAKKTDEKFIMEVKKYGL